MRLIISVATLMIFPNVSSFAQSKPLSAKVMSNVVVSQHSMESCPEVFQIKPDTLNEFRLTKEKMGDKFLKLKPANYSLLQCLERAKEYINGPQSLYFLGLTDKAKQVLVRQ